MLLFNEGEPQVTNKITSTISRIWVRFRLVAVFFGLAFFLAWPIAVWEYDDQEVPLLEFNKEITTQDVQDILDETNQGWDVVNYEVVGPMCNTLYIVARSDQFMGTITLSYPIQGQTCNN
jgi:hypothetical protein